ncbi:MAG: beta-galactosidase [Verrucomicrobiales bacterium]|nr:beta-galactosidase [Verrucomicrobiales bacterium]MCP5559119.1 beta-galactosidase [Verrucomicrobiaceae bacterium]
MRAALCLLSSIMTVAGNLAAGEPASTLRPWEDYRVILWTGEKAKQRLADPVFHKRLKEMGVTHGMTGQSGDPKPLLEAGFGYYVENIVNEGLCLKFNSTVTDWNKFIDGWMGPRPASALVRDVCLNDTDWLERMSERMRSTAERHADSAPLLYDLRDELSTTTSANPFDYDFSETALEAFRAWLQKRYASIDALNTQWGTKFPNWAEVRPFTTDQIKQRMVSGSGPAPDVTDWSAVKGVKLTLPNAHTAPQRWNFAPWADHRSFMDDSLAEALAQFRRASHEVDPATPVGIEGAQMPHAFGGYDLWKLSQALDWMEPYDVCDSREILGSFMPGRPMLATVFEKETRPALRRLWHLLLEGDKGCIIWWSEDTLDWSDAAVPLTPKAEALAPVFKELTGPIARLFLNAKPERDPIAIHYSQPSIQVAWLLESTVDGKTWVRRFSSYEATHNRHAQVRSAWLKALQDLGFSPQFISSQQLESGVLTGTDFKLFITPQSWAMSGKEISAIDSFCKTSGHLVIHDGPAGWFDEHATLQTARLPQNSTANEETVWIDRGHVKGTLDAGALDMPLDHSFSAWVADRLNLETDSEQIATLQELLARQNLIPPVRVPATARVRVHRYTTQGPARLLAFERNISYKMSESLAQAGGNEALEKPSTFTAEWDEPVTVIDLIANKNLGVLTQLDVTLDPWHPALFALLPQDPAGDDPVQAVIDLIGK